MTNAIFCGQNNCFSWRNHRQLTFGLRTVLARRIGCAPKSSEALDHNTTTLICECFNLPKFVLKIDMTE